MAQLHPDLIPFAAQRIEHFRVLQFTQPHRRPDWQYRQSSPYHPNRILLKLAIVRNDFDILGLRLRNDHPVISLCQIRICVSIGYHTKWTNAANKKKPYGWVAQKR